MVTLLCMYCWRGRGSSSHPCTEILCCFPLEERELFSKGMEVRIKLLVELRDEGETQEGETFLPEKSHATVGKHSMRNMTSQLTVLSLEFAFSPPTLFPFLTLFFLSLLVLLSSFHWFQLWDSWEKGEWKRWFIFSGPFGAGMGSFLCSLQELAHLCKPKLEVALMWFEYAKSECLVCTLACITCYS